MLESIRQLFDKAVEFCRDQSDAIMMIGAIVVILIIIIAVIRSIAKKEINDEDLDFDESIYFGQAEEENQDKGNKESHDEELKDKDELTDKPEKPFSEDSRDGKNIEMKQDSEDEKSEASHKCTQNIIFPEELIQEIAKVSSKDLQEVEIKIQSAELRIKYCDCKEDGGSQQEVVKTFEESEELAEALQEDSIESKSATKSYEDMKDLDKDLSLFIEQDRREPVERHGKFGPNNFNTTRSGRVFTEEELERQIRD